MSSPAPSAPLPPRKLDYLAAILSYLLPGLGQVMQGRIGKGLLFFICLYALFFYGLWMGQLKNVWLPDPKAMPDADAPLVGKLDGAPKALYHRPQFLGQFWMGVAAWPAVLQYIGTDTGDGSEPPPPSKLLGRYMQAPSEAELNTLQRSGDKRWDLGWVFTVIAGVLNVLVIYDALAGPVVRDELETPAPTPPSAPPVVPPPPPTPATKGGAA